MIGHIFIIDYFYTHKGKGKELGVEHYSANLKPSPFGGYDGKYRREYIKLFKKYNDALKYVTKKSKRLKHVDVQDMIKRRR